MSATLDGSHAQREQEPQSLQHLHPKQGFDVAALLALWEACVDQPQFARDEALLRAAHDGAAVPDALGERNARLLELHSRLFGGPVELTSECPRCGTAAGFSGDCNVLAAACSAGVTAREHRLEADGFSIDFRLPHASDVIAVASACERDGDEFASQLLACCVLECRFEGRAVEVGDLPARVVDRLSSAMEAHDPGATVSFAVSCPECTAHWDAPLDPGRMVWDRLRAAAERLLLDIDALARAYGWTETEILRLGPTRRAAYVQLAGA